MLDILVKQSRDQSPHERYLKVSNKADKPIISVLKSVSWRIIGTLDTIIISYFITGKVELAVSIGGIEVISKTILYYFHERLWSHIHRIKLNFFKRRNEKRDKVRRVGRFTGRKNSRRIAAGSYITVSG